MRCDPFSVPVCLLRAILYPLHKAQHKYIVGFWMVCIALERYHIKVLTQNHQEREKNESNLFSLKLIFCLHYNTAPRTHTCRTFSRNIVDLS